MVKPWKTHEDKVAQRLKTNVPRSRNGRFDSDNKNIVVECKWRSKHAAWGWFAKLEAKAKKYAPGKRPVLVLKEKGRHGELVVLRLTQEVADWLNKES